MNSFQSPLQADLIDHAVRGVMWEPEGRPAVPAEWISDLVVAGGAGDRDVHPKGVRVQAVTLTGSLNLEFVDLKVPLWLNEVDVENPVNLSKARGSWVVITGCRIPRVWAQDLRLEYSLDLSYSEIEGPVVLSGAEIGTGFDCIRAVVRNPGGTALSIALMRAGRVDLTESRFEGEVEMGYATIVGPVDCSGATFHNPGEDALTADGLRAGSMYVRDSQFEGEVRLLTATIEGNLDFHGASFSNRHGHAVWANWLTVQGPLQWDGLSGVEGFVDFASARIALLRDDPEDWQFDDMTYGLEGLRVDEFDDWTWQERKRWLDGSKSDGPGPYEMVARWYRTVGRDHDARQIGIAKHNARYKALTWWRKPLHWLWGMVAGYGYQPWRAAALLVVFYAAGVVAFSISEMIPTQSPPVYDFNVWVYSADTVIPLVDFKQAANWAPAGTSGLWTMWTLIAAGWALSIALIAAVSGVFTQN